MTRPHDSLLSGLSIERSTRPRPEGPVSWRRPDGLAGRRLTGREMLLSWPGPRRAKAGAMLRCAGERAVGARGAGGPTGAQARAGGPMAAQAPVMWGRALTQAGAGCQLSR
jgi:hypothetical protein